MSIWGILLWLMRASAMSPILGSTPFVDMPQAQGTWSNLSIAFDRFDDSLLVTRQQCRNSGYGVCHLCRLQNLSPRVFE